MSQTWYGIPREEVPWHPTVDDAKCIGCRTCYDFCTHGVYGWDDGRQQPTIASPTSCVVGCIGCRGQCPVEAISFPTLAVLKELLDRRSKD